MSAYTDLCGDLVGQPADEGGLFSASNYGLGKGAGLRVLKDCGRGLFYYIEVKSYETAAARDLYRERNGPFDCAFGQSTSVPTIIS